MKGGGKMTFNKEQLKREINELESKRSSLKEQLNKAKSGKNFLQRTGINVGAAGKIAQINKAIGERKRILRLLNQKESLKIKKDVLNLEKDVNKSKEELRKQRAELSKGLNESVFGVDDIFKI